MIEFFSIQSIINAIKGQWKTAIIIVLLVPVLAVGISFLFPNLYKSNVIVYPANNYLNDRNYYYNNSIQNLYSQYGGDDDIDKIIEIGSIKNVLEAICDSLNLAEHYNINESNKNLAIYKAGKKLDDRIQFLHTKNNALEISVWDTDRKKAADILLNLLQNINTYILNLQEQRVANEVYLLDSKIQLIKKELDLYNNATTAAANISKQAIALQLAETEKLKISIIASPNAGRAFYQANKIYTGIKKDKPNRLLLAIFSSIAGAIFAMLYTIFRQFYKGIK